MAPSFGGGAVEVAERMYDMAAGSKVLPSHVDMLVDVAAGEDAEIERTKPHPLHAPAAPSREDFKAKGPVIATGHPILQGSQVVDGNPNTSAQINLNERVLELDTDVFKGKLLLSVRGCPNSHAATKPGGALACGRRTFHVAVQGSFKRPMAAEDLLSGQEFPKAPRLSASFMHFVFSGAAKVFASTTDVFVHDGKPMHFMFPVLAAAQLINVAEPGQEPPILDAHEDMRLWCPELTARGGGPASSDKRRRFFDVASNMTGRVVPTDQVWTLHITQSLIDFSTYKLGLPGVPVHIDLVSLLDTQPLQIMAKNAKTGEYVFNFLMWNERLMHHEGLRHDYDAKEQQTAAAKMKDRFKGLLAGW